MPMWTKVSFQNSNSPLMEHLTFFHDHSMIILISMTILTLSTMLYSIFSVNLNRYFMEYQEMEIFWTSIPALMLMFISLPSLKTLYLMEENIKPTLMLKVMGYQWNWSYEYSNILNKKFLSTIENSLLMRLIETSNHLLLPMKTPTLALVSSKDVLHSWTVPSLGIKADASPGRMNQLSILINKPGVLIGQCSEICGAGHSFMPITLESVSMNKFIKSLYFSKPSGNSLLSFF